MLDNEWLNILCCPETHQKVVCASIQDLQTVNEKIAAGLLKNREGQSVREFMEGLLIREDRQFGYPIRGGIPVLLISEAIPLQLPVSNP